MIYYIMTQFYIYHYNDIIYIPLGSIHVTLSVLNLLQADGLHFGLLQSQVPRRANFLHFHILFPQLLLGLIFCLSIPKHSESLRHSIFALSKSILPKLPNMPICSVHVLSYRVFKNPACS